MGDGAENCNALRFCGLGLLEAEEVERMLSGEYGKKIPPAPPEGLVLWHIEYPGIGFEGDEKGIKRPGETFLSAIQEP